MPVAHPGSAYGWRARIGLLQPTLVSDNNPIEFYLMAPPGVQMVLTSLGIRGTGPRNEEYAQAMEGIEEPIRRVLSRDVDAIVQAGVPPIVTRGWGFEDEIRSRVEKITSIPFATDIGSCIAAMHALGISRAAILASVQMQEGMADYLHHAGIAVVATRPLESGPNGPHSDSLEVAYRGGVRLHQAAPQAECILIPGANRPTVGMIDALEQDTGIAVVTSAQAIMWQGLRLTGVNTGSVTGFGRLFQAG